MENTCSTECLETIHLPWEEQVKLRKGLQVGNKVFRKGKSEALKFKNSGDLSTQTLAKATKAETKDIRQKIKRKNFDRKSGALLFKIKNRTVLH
jgi:UPF0176 protein